MKILAVADDEAKYLYDYYAPGKLDGVDLILSCGDLHPEYLEFLVTMSGVPLLYVRGNHDDYYAKLPPGGCDCIEDKLVVINGVRILGLGGSIRYRQGDNMYTEWQMARRIRRLAFQIWRHKGFDILLTHSPARHLGDLEDKPHRGFECFVKLLDKYKPKYFIHGHIHACYDIKVSQKSHYGETTIINASDYIFFDY